MRGGPIPVGARLTSGRLPDCIAHFGALPRGSVPYPAACDARPSLMWQHRGCVTGTGGIGLLDLPCIASSTPAETAVRQAQRVRP